MELGALHLSTIFSSPGALCRTSSSQRLTTTKVRPLPSSYVSLYVPPHHRLLSVITSFASIPNISSTSPGVDENHTNNSSVTSPCNTSNLSNHYPYSPTHCEHQKNNSSVDSASEVDAISEFEFSANPDAFESDNVDSWKWRLTTLINSKDKQELVSREKKDRRDYEQIAALASTLGLHSRLYVKVIVVSKVPLPNYRFDLDDKRPLKEVILPPGLQRRVDAHLGKYLSQKTKSVDGSRDNLFTTAINIGSTAINEGPFEQKKAFPKNEAAVDSVLCQRSKQLSMEQQAWQKSLEGQKMLEFRRSLPAYKEKDAILSAISKNQVKLVAGRQHKFPSLF